MALARAHTVGEARVANLFYPAQNEPKKKACCKGSPLQKHTAGIDPRVREVGGSWLGSCDEKLLPVPKQNVPSKSPRRAAEDQRDGKQTPEPGQPEHC